MADVRELADLVEGVGQLRHLAGDDHHVDVGVGDLEAVLEVGRRDVDVDLGTDRHDDLARREAPGLREDVGLVLAVAELADAGLGPRPLRRARSGDRPLASSPGSWKPAAKPATVTAAKNPTSRAIETRIQFFSYGSIPMASCGLGGLAVRRVESCRRSQGDAPTQQDHVHRCPEQDDRRHEQHEHEDRARRLEVLDVVRPRRSDGVTPSAASSVVLLGMDSSRRFGARSSGEGVARTSHRPSVSAAGQTPDKPAIGPDTTRDLSHLLVTSGFEHDTDSVAQRCCRVHGTHAATRRPIARGTRCHAGDPRTTHDGRTWWRWLPAGSDRHRRSAAPDVGARAAASRHRARRRHAPRRRRGVLGGVLVVPPAGRGRHRAGSSRRSRTTRTSTDATTSSRCHPQRA